MPSPLELLRHHVTGAIERGEATAIVGIPATPDVKFIASSFGGGWAVPFTDEGRDYLTDYLDEGPAELAPLGGQEGWIIEPYMIADLAAAMQSSGLTWERG